MLVERHVDKHEVERLNRLDRWALDQSAAKERRPRELVVHLRVGIVRCEARGDEAPDREHHEADREPVERERLGRVGRWIWAVDDRVNPGLVLVRRDGAKPECVEMSEDTDWMRKKKRRMWVNVHEDGEAEEGVA